MPMSDYMRSIREKVGCMLLEVPAVTVLTFDERRRVLLVKHGELDLWTTPGGAVEPNEVPADAAVREMWEETGLEVELIRVMGVYGGPEFEVTYANGDAISYLDTVFEARVLGGTLRPDGEECVDVGYFSESELDDLALQPAARLVLNESFRERSVPYFEPATWRPGSANCE